jgi:hypothetical protein
VIGGARNWGDKCFFTLQKPEMGPSGAGHESRERSGLVLICGRVSSRETRKESVGGRKWRRREVERRKWQRRLAGRVWIGRSGTL